MIRVMIADDQPMLREGLKTILSAHPQIDVVAEASRGASAVSQLSALEVDVVVMDIRMPGMDGVEATKQIRSKYGDRDLKILVLTTFDQDENVLAAIRAGADGFLSKGAGPKELTDAIIKVTEGEHALSNSAVGALIEHVVQTPSKSSDPRLTGLFEQLTEREREVVGLIVEGLTNQEIAELLCVSPYTVKTHANRAMTKVEARDRAQLVSAAVRAGILP